MQNFYKRLHHINLRYSYSALCLLAVLLFSAWEISAQTQTQTQTAGTDASNAPGAVAWTDPGNTAASDDMWATAAVNDNNSEFLQLSDFGFSIPAGATIDGIEVSIERSIDNAGGGRAVQDVVVQLLDAAGSATGDDKAATMTNWPTTDATATYGGSSDNWSISWSVSDINDADFGIQIQVTGQSPGGSTVTAQIDQVQITVYYSSSCNLTASAGTITNVTCNGDDDGSIEITTSMGTGVNGEYDYAWSGAESGSANNQNDSYTIPNLSGGTYDITVTNGTGCTAEVTGVTVNEPPALSATPSVTDVSTNGDNDGQIELTISGGTGDYDIAWEEDGNTGNNGSANNQTFPYDITGLTAGDYDITIIDDNTCTLVLQDVTVDEPEACNITASGLSSVTNNDGGTPNDPTDDPIILSLNPTGSTGLGANYTVTATQDGNPLNVSPATAQNYGSSVQFTFTATGGNDGPAGFGDIIVTITDGNTPGCTFVIDPVTDPGTGSACPTSPYSGGIQTPVINN